MKIYVNGKAIDCAMGEKLSDIMIKHMLMLPLPCGGKGTCGKCLVKINGKTEKACQYTVLSDIIVEANFESNIVSESGIDISEGTATELVLDIGTTTIALASVNMQDKTVTSVTSFNNPQRTFGADVISRIEYAQKNNVNDMTLAIRQAVNKSITELTGNYDILHVSGNTAMLHIFLGKDPSSMGVFPYTPIFLDEKMLDAKKYGIENVHQLHILPSISAFVGADLVAGVSLIGMPQDKYRLLIDLGTNAEILLISKDRILATSAAAGPCFEGANISCGMSATEGAIFSFDEGGYKTIGNIPPKGICGTGLIDIIAYLLRNELIDKTGFMDGDFTLTTGIKLTLGDIRQYQLAKSAVYSGILTLVKKANITFDDIEGMYVSGGFSAKLNLGNAVLTGLLPRELMSKFNYIGNSSLLGTIKAITEKESFSHITEISQYIDLSNDSYFSNQFMENIDFTV